MYIGITTFKERFDTHFKSLLEDIKGYPAIVAVNASYKTGLCKEYSKEMLKLLSCYDNVTPIFYQQMRGCSKMWNDLVIHSPSEDIIITNDDNRILNTGQFMDECISFSKINKFYLINQSMSHFVVGKKILMELNWFDERFLGFGEEDGDILWRYLNKYKIPMPSLYTNLIENNSSYTEIDTNIKTYAGKYTDFNRQFCYVQNNIHNMPCKYVPDLNGLQSTYSVKMKQQLLDQPQYPYEDFFLRYKDSL